MDYEDDADLSGMAQDEVSFCNCPSIRDFKNIKKAMRKDIQKMEIAEGRRWYIERRSGIERKSPKGFRFVIEMDRRKWFRPVEFTGRLNLKHKV